MPVISLVPYRNLILTGSVGSGKTGVARLIAQKMEGVNFVDVETEIERREGYPPEQLRAIFGMARLRSAETQLIQEISLHRSTIIAVSGSTMLDPPSFERLQETGPILCLTAELGELLRRLHVQRGGWFHEPNNRATLIGKLKRERQVLALDIPRLDTSALSLEAVAEQAIEFWRSHADT